MVDRIAFAELHCHTNFSFLDGASPPDELVERAAALGLSGLAITDHAVQALVIRDGQPAQPERRSPFDQLVRR